MGKKMKWEISLAYWLQSFQGTVQEKKQTNKQNKNKKTLRLSSADSVS